MHHTQTKNGCIFREKICRFSLFICVPGRVFDQKSGRNSRDTGPLLHGYEVF